MSSIISNNFLWKENKMTKETRTVEQLIKDHTKFIQKLANRYGNNNNRDDLFQEGVLGVMKAAEKFDDNHQVKFLTYANYWIVHYMLRYLKKEQRYVPTELEHMEQQSVEYLSLIEAKDVTDKALEVMKKENITDRDIDIIKSRYLTADPDTLQTLATKYGITRERVRQIETRWTNLIKNKLEII